jgi:hypothetical protein
MTRSNQSERHASMLMWPRDVLVRREWILRCEELHTDIVAFLPGRSGVWAIECERRANAYWIRRNLFRNDRAGAVGIVVVAETEKVAAGIRAIVGELPGELRGKVWVVPIEGFTDLFVQNVMEGKG